MRPCKKDGSNGYKRSIGKWFMDGVAHKIASPNAPLLFLLCSMIGAWRRPVHSINPSSTRRRRRMAVVVAVLVLELPKTCLPRI